MQTIRKTETIVCVLDQTKRIFPVAIILTIQRIKHKRAKKAKSICLLKATGQIVAGRKNKGTKNTVKHRTALMDLSNKLDIGF